MTAEGLIPDIGLGLRDKLLRLWLFVYTTPPPASGW